MITDPSKLKHSKWVARKQRIRRKVEGSAARPRLTVFRSNSNIFAQVIDDAAGRTLVSASTLDKALRDGLKGLKPREQAEKVGEALAQRCIAAHIDKIVFDRNGYRYHGRVLSLAEGARKAGLAF